jgi:hypothetical protein
LLVPALARDCRGNRVNIGLDTFHERHSNSVPGELQSK